MKLRSLLRLAARNTARHRVRTGLTAGMVVLGVALLIVALTWIRGAIGRALETATGMGGHVRVATRGYAEREEMFPLYENLTQIDRLTQELEGQPGVVAVEPRIVAGVTVTVGEELGDVFALAVGANERYFRERLDVKDRVVAGTWFTGQPNEVIAGARVAEQVHAKVGDKLLLLGVTQDGSLSPIEGRLIGIIKGGNALVDRQILVPLEKMRWLADISEGATELLVFTDQYEKAAALAPRLRALPALQPYSVQAWTDREPWRSTLGTVRAVQTVVVFIIVFLTALGIWNTMMMSVLERTHEIGVLRAMGLSRSGAVGLFLIEALAIAVAGGALGVALGYWPARWLETHGLQIGARTAANITLPLSEVVRGQLTPGIMLGGFALGLLTAVVGSVLPAIRAASIQPVSAMRSGR